MGASTNVTVSKMELTPQRVNYNSQDLGGTLGNVEISVTLNKGEIKADQFGTTILDRRVNGIAVTVKTKIAEVRDPAVWAKVFPNADFYESGADKVIQFGLPIGASDLDQAKELRLHPVVADDTDLTQDWLFPLAFPKEATPITYGPEEQSSLEVTWDIYRMTGGTDKGNGGIWFKFGDVDLEVPES